MLPGPEKIIACPHCEALERYMTPMSGNTFGARIWTDGKQVAPMLPRPPAVAMCHQCGQCYWLEDAREVGEDNSFWDAEGGKVDPAWDAAPGVEEPTENEYYQALQIGLAKDSQQERTLRILAWWRRNDALRDDDQALATAANASLEMGRKNLEGLIPLLSDTNENDQVMKAEVLRQLGDFESAKQVLGRVSSPRYAMVVSQLRLLCDAQDDHVRELKFGR